MSAADIVRDLKDFGGGRWGPIVNVPSRLLRDAADEIERLQAWKAEATEVIGSWEQVWEALGRPGRLGESKAVAVLRAVSREGPVQ